MTLNKVKYCEILRRALLALNDRYNKYTRPRAVHAGAYNLKLNDTPPRATRGAGFLLLFINENYVFKFFVFFLVVISTKRSAWRNLFIRFFVVPLPKADFGLRPALRMTEWRFLGKLGMTVGADCGGCFGYVYARFFFGFSPQSPSKFRQPQKVVGGYLKGLANCNNILRRGQAFILFPK